MKNYCIKQNGREYWISRAITVVTFVFCKIHEEWHILANKRGKGTPDYQGYWNVPCGYLEFYETIKEAASREVWEECGVKIDINKIHMISINDDPTEPKQNVTIRFKSILSDADNISVATGLNTRGGEKDEVATIQWIPLSQIDSLSWAFNHKQLIKKYADRDYWKETSR